MVKGESGETGGEEGAGGERLGTGERASMFLCSLILVILSFVGASLLQWRTG